MKLSAIDIGRRWLGRRETHGKNRSPEIDALNVWMGIGLGNPYCATGVCWCFAEARKSEPMQDRTEIPKTASSVALRNWFIDRSRLSWDAQSLLNWKGAIGGWTNEDGKHGHTFLIEKRYTSMFGLGRKVVAIGTIEFNSNGSGSRDGEGVVRLKRKVTDKKFWYCDTGGLSGGSWW